MKAKIVILCPIEEEYAAIGQQLHDSYFHIGQHSDRQYQIGHFGKYAIALLQTGRGADAVSNAVHIVVKDFDPQYLFLVGTAGGIAKIKIGDIVIASAAYQYEWGREVEEGFHSSPKTLEADTRLFPKIQLAKKHRFWTEYIADATDLKVLKKPIASGSKVIETRAGISYQLIRERYNEAVALEMEAYSFQAAINNYPEVQSLNIRSIADRLADKQNANEVGSKGVAARNAAAFAFALIQTLKVSRDAYFPYKRLALVATVLIFIVLISFQRQATYLPFQQFSLDQQKVDSNVVVLPPVEKNLETTKAKKDTIKYADDETMVAQKKEKREAIFFKKEIMEDTTFSEEAIAEDTLQSEILVNIEDDSSEKPEPSEVIIEQVKKWRANCYIGVTNGDHEISNVYIYIDEEKIQTANNFLSLPIGASWMKLRKGNKFYEQKIIVEKATLEPIFMIEWKDFSIEEYNTNTTVKSTKIKR